MEKILGEKFLKGREYRKFDPVDSVKLFVCIYFGASWCSGSRAFTPILKEAYEKINADEKTIEVVYCSCDAVEHSFHVY